MKKNFMLLMSWALLAALVVGFSCASIKEVDRKDIHLMKAEDSCKHCHISTGPELKFASSQLCLRCHPQRGNDHPIEMSSTTPDSSALPLSMEGEMTCFTCHEVHPYSASPPASQPPYLRMSFNDLCFSCHAY